MLPPKPNKRITSQVRPTQPRAKNMEKGCAMVVDRMDMSGLCVHTRVGPTSVKRPNKRNLTSCPTKRKVMDKALVSCSKKLGQPTKKCPMYQEARKEAQVATRRCYGCNEMGHKVNRYPYKQSKHRANKGRICYACRRTGHLSYECPNGNAPKPNTYVYNDMLRKTTNVISTSKVTCSPQTSTKAIWVPKCAWVNDVGTW